MNPAYLDALKAFEDQYSYYDPTPLTPDQFLMRRNSLLRGIQGRMWGPPRVTSGRVTLTCEFAANPKHEESWTVRVLEVPVGLCGPSLEGGWSISPDAVIRTEHETPVLVGYGVDGPREAVVWVVERVNQLFVELAENDFG